MSSRCHATLANALMFSDSEPFSEKVIPRCLCEIDSRNIMLLKYSGGGELVSLF